MLKCIRDFERIITYLNDGNTLFFFIYILIRVRSDALSRERKRMVVSIAIYFLLLRKRGDLALCRQVLASNKVGY